ncbi:pore-forming ESAT-6 family protein [Bosea sp. NBC_00550]|uniref:pore-forming ESAT-6 family protein n=1 Tax=Bosea sp. NBC_00550 TaxID=2969621 RepID=UPI00222FA576|nr:pore-forming ESAT-6 family protein [Bosea sp. NBC_00550]UZF93857.1 pore-forming ESAT-6 family protein [Bosea sp. NBC_00550]
MIFYKSLIAASAVAVLASAAPSLAQTQADQLKVAYQAARNQLGILGYCADKGHIDASAVDVQKKMMGLIPTPADVSGGDAAEAAGRKGTISAMGMEQNIEVIAKAQNGTPAAYCKQIGDLVKQMGAKLPQ